MGTISVSETPLYVSRGFTGRNCGAMRDACNYIALSEPKKTYIRLQLISCSGGTLEEPQKTIYLRKVAPTLNRDADI